jgi:putative transposase
MKTAYKFRMYPNRQQVAQLELTLDTCRYLYNLALADRKNVYETEGIGQSYEDQAAKLTVERKNGNFNSIYAHCLQDVLRRLDKSFKAFFRRVKAGEEPGYPRFKGEGWYKSFTYPDSETGYKLDGSKLTLSKIGSIRIFKHREVEGKIKTCTIKKDNLGHWYAILISEVEDVSPIEPKTAIGVDVA